MKKNKVIALVILVLVLIGIVWYNIYGQTTLKCTRSSGQTITYKIGSKGLADIKYSGEDFDEDKVAIIKNILDSQIKDAATITRKKAIIRQYELSLNSTCK